MDPLTSRPLQLGPWTLPVATYLAPMAGLTNRAFRQLCRELGGVGMVCSELISSQVLELRGHRQPPARLGVDFSASEAPLAVQLFGAEPTTMAEAARILEGWGAPMIDINMGCWVPKVVRRGGGAALLEDPLQAARVVEAVVSAVSLPVSVKVRSGPAPDRITAPEFARLAQDSGACALAVHARCACEGFQGQADWSVIAQVCQSVRLPVFGNGDLRTPEDARAMQRATGCHGWMVGRAAIGHPWIFAQWLGLLPWGTPPLGFRARVARRHVALTQQHTGLSELRAARELRGQLAGYQLGQRANQRLLQIDTFQQAFDILEGLSDEAEPEGPDDPTRLRWPKSPEFLPTTCERSLRPP